MSKNVFTEEGRTRFRNFIVRLRGYLLVFGLIGVLAGGLYWWYWVWPAYRPLEKIYLQSFIVATIKAKLLPVATRGKYTMLVSDAGGGRVAILDDDMAHPVRDEEGRAVKDQYGYVFQTNQGVKLPGFQWRKLSFPDTEAERLFREGVYKNSLLGLFAPAGLIALVILVGGSGVLMAVDLLINRKYESGKRVRGSRLVEPKQYQREHKEADGLALVVKPLAPEQGIKRLWSRILAEDEPSYELRMRKSEEAQGALILGDIGSGKSQILHRYLAQIAQRKDERAVVYDPACEFIKAHYRPQRGDVILNPLDQRSPFWSPAFECGRKNKTDYLTLADSFFPGRGDRMTSTEKFFNDAARDIFARMLEFDPDPERLVAWLSDEKQIRELTDRTELAHYIDPDAKGQKGGVLSTLAKVGKTMRLLPKADECKIELSLSRWAEEGRGWIFLTSTKETEERLRPLYAAYLDLLMRRLLSVDDEAGRRRPVKLIVDEVHTLDYLPTLYKATTEGRKFGLHLIQGTQNKAQYDARYGQDAATILSCPRYSILLRCKEPESAMWLSKLIGEEERERPKTGVTASVSDQGRDSINYASQTERRAVVSREEIAALPDLCGYWKYGDAVVPFRFDFWKPKRIAEGFIPRQSAEQESTPENAPAIPKEETTEPVKVEERANVWEILRDEK
jgi:hypothetical protein